MSSVNEGTGLRMLARRLRPVLSVIRVHVHLLVWSMVLGAASQLLMVAAAGLGALLVGMVATGADTAQVTRVLWLLVAVVVLQGAAHLGETWTAHVGAFRALADLRRRSYEAIERLAPGGTVRRRTGDLASVSMSDVELLELFFAHTVGPLVVALVVPTAVLVGVAAVEPTVALVMVPFVVLVATVPAWLHRRGEEQGNRERAESGALAARLVDDVQGIREIVAFDATEHQVAGLRRAGRALREVHVAHGSRVGIERAATDGLVTVGVLAVLGVATALATDGRLDTRYLPVVVVLAAAAFVPVTTLTTTAVELGRVAAAADRLHVLLNAPALVTDPVDAGVNSAAGAIRRVEDVGGADRGAGVGVVLRGVRFRYAPDLPEVLRGVDLDVRPGETVALVGSSGAGKSTCASLVLRLWDATAGTVEVGGTDVRELSLSQLRQLVAAVPQDVHLFDESVRDNIALGAPDATDDQVRAAASAAAVDEVVDALPEGYGTRLGERGTRLSGGQRQRLAIARAVLRDAPVLVLDEAVSSLDAESEDLVRQAVADLRRDRTTLVIAHRLSTIRAADRVVVLEAGRVVEQGTYDELVRADGAFFALVGAGLDIR